MKILKQFTLLTILGCCAQFFPSCVSPRAIIRITPNESSTQEIPQRTHWYMGTGYAQVTQDSIGMVVGFDREVDGMLLFDVEINNLSSKTILMSPETFAFKIEGTPIQNGVDNKVYAINPEVQLLEIDKALARQDARMQNAATASVVFGLLATAATVVSVVNDAIATEKAVNNADAFQSLAIMNNNAGQIAADAYQRNAWKSGNLHVLRETWERTMLRRTHIYPNENLRGLVAFKPIRGNYQIRLILPIELMVFQLLFKQTIHLSQRK